MWDPFVQWMKNERVEEWELLDDDKWIEPDYRSSDEGRETLCRIFERYSMKHDKLHIYEAGQAARVAISPVSNGKDLLENPQLRALDFWQTIKHDGLDGEVTYPGAPYALGNMRWRLGNPAPSFGQHTGEILSELGYTKEEIESLAKREVIHVG